MKRGQMILPPSITGAPSLSEFGAAGVHRTDRVYVTTDINAAMMYASFYHTGKGAVYECLPMGTLEPDEDCTLPGLSYSCEQARIVKVHRMYPSVMAMVREAVCGPA